MIRKHFGTVLNHDYDALHRDHFHFDDGQSVGWVKRARSHVLFVQYALNYLLGVQIRIDGAYGPETDGALRVCLAELGVGGIGSLHNWLSFLDICAARAFEMA